MSAVLAVAGYTVKEHLRHKAWLSALLFGLAMAAGAPAVSGLAQPERARLMLDLGLAANELIALFTAVFLSAHLVSREIESRAIFLVLTHPVPRSRYLWGRFLGTLAASAAGLAALGAAHWSLLRAFGGVPLGAYALACAASLAKVALMSSLAVLLSLALTSEAAALSFSAFLWVLGHFSGELRVLADRSPGAPLRALLNAASWAAPDLALFSAKGFFSAFPEAGARAAGAALYAAFYCAACLALASQLLEEKEF